MAGVKLSNRLQAIANMVSPGNRVADIGCDHGFVSIYLVQSGIAPMVIAMDVRKGPLGMAKEHICQAGLGEQIETRLSDGLEQLRLGEADSLVIAGMGGPLMQGILERGRYIATGVKELILQPQSEIPQFRRYLRRNGFSIVEEKVILEDGKFYFPMRVIPEDRGVSYLGKNSKAGLGGEALDEVTPEELTIQDYFGPMLLQERSELFLEYLKKELHTSREVLQKLMSSPGERTSVRMNEVREEIKRIESVLDMTV